MADLHYFLNKSIVCYLFVHLIVSGLRKIK